MSDPTISSENFQKPEKPAVWNKELELKPEFQKLPGYSESLLTTNQKLELKKPGFTQGFTPEDVSLIPELELKNNTKKISDISPAELKKLGRKLDKKEFFDALIPAALESERVHGIPAELSLVQAAIETDFARASIGGYNLFGIKGSGPAGTITLKTKEYKKDGTPYYIRDNFAKYNNFNEAFLKHGELFHNKYFKKITEEYIDDKDMDKFINKMAKRYSTNPNYARVVKSRIEKYNLEELTNKHRYPEAYPFISD